MDIHYFLIAIFIVAIIVFQVRIYIRTREKRKQFEGVFPDNAEEEWVILKSNGVQIVSKRKQEALAEIADSENSVAELTKKLDSIQKTIDKYERFKENATDEEYLSRYDEVIEENKKQKIELSSVRNNANKQIKLLEDEVKSLDNVGESLENGTRREIITSINRYLEKNRNAVTDFNLIRDIIDRNCDAIEDEIQTQIPIPLYFGLIGTMLGILIGVGALVATGSLENLLTSFQAPVGVEEGSEAWRQAKEAYDSQATEGIVSLFGGIALAMVSSIIGILLTTIGSLNNKNAKAVVEQKKHKFISWLQAELLPKISTDFSSALIQLGHDLTGFNASFSTNANLLKRTISEISSATVAQSNLLNSIERLDIARIAKANIAVYEQLKNCTEDIASLARNLKEIQNSISGIGQFMENGINEYEKRNTYIQDASGKVDIAVRQGQELLSQRANEIFAKYDELLHTLYMRSETTTRELAQKYDIEADKLHRAIVEKLTDVKQLETELKNLVAVKTSINNLEKAITEQNRKIDSLASAIRDLAQVKVSGGTTHVEMKMPILYKVVIIVSGSIITLTGLFFITLRILEIFGITL